MKKVFFTAFAALAFAFTMTACSGNNGTNDSAADTTKAAIATEEHHCNHEADSTKCCMADSAKCEKACEHKCDKAEGKECCKKAEGKECDHKCDKACDHKCQKAESKECCKKAK